MMKTDGNRKRQPEQGMRGKRTDRMAVCLAWVFLALSLAGCVQTAPAAPAASTGTTASGTADSSAASQDETSVTTDTAQETRVFTDSVGREVELPARIERVAVTGPFAQLLVFALAPDTLVGISSEWSAETLPYIPETYHGLPVLGQLYGGKGEINQEELLRAAPQVVIDVGEPKKTITEDLDGLQEQLEIPFVHVSASLSSMDESCRMLGELLGRQEEAEALAAYCRESYDRIAALADSVEKVRLLYITGENGLHVIARGSVHAEAIDLLSENLAVVAEPSSKGTGNEADLEQIMQWNPDVILFSPESIYESAGGMPEWRTISAVANGRYYEVPSGPYNWMGFPPTIQRILGIQWMAKLLYPEQADYDLYEKAKEFYSLVFHHDLTKEEYEALVANSILKDAR